MTESQIITLTCENQDCNKITNKIKVFEEYATDLRRIIKNSNNYCLECHQEIKERERRIIKETGEIKGFKL